MQTSGSAHSTCSDGCGVVTLRPDNTCAKRLKINAEDVACLTTTSAKTPGTSSHRRHWRSRRSTKALDSTGDADWRRMNLKMPCGKQDCIRQITGRRTVQFASFKIFGGPQREGTHDVLQCTTGPKTRANSSSRIFRPQEEGIFEFKQLHSAGPMMRAHSISR